MLTTERNCLRPYTLVDYHPTADELRSDAFDEPGTVSLPPRSPYTDGPYWIIKQDDNGIAWTWQVGGYACLHPVFRGVLFAPDAELGKALERIEQITYAKYGGYCVPATHFFHDEGAGKSLQNEDADCFDRLLACCKSHTLRIDRRKLGESSEAWIYALIDDEPCVLTGVNSD